jgi:hypothetical protein
MVDFVYTAERALKTGHTAGTDYTISINIQTGDPQPMPVQTVSMSLSGNQVTTVSRLDQHIDINTDFFNASTTPDYDDMHEFMYSVLHGETFSYAGSDVKLVGTPRLNRTGVYFTWSFTLRYV